MKKNLYVLLCIFLFILCTTDLSCQEDRLCIYLCSRLTEPAKQWNDIITGELSTEFGFFRPQDINLDDVPTNRMDDEIYQADLEGMNQSDLLLVLPPYGRDCAWEIGWFCGKEKPALAYVEVEGDWLRDAMVKGGLTAIITTNPLLHDQLLKDSASAKKAYLIPSRQYLGMVIKQIYYEDVEDHKGKIATFEPVTAPSLLHF